MDNIRYFELLVLILPALASDIKTYKIKNIIVLPFIPLGLATNFIIDGTDGAVCSVLGAVLPVFLLLFLYGLKMLGAGDIKLFSAIGAIMGSRFVLYAIAYSFIAGGAIALTLILFRKNGKERIIHLVNYFKLCIFTFTLHPYTDFKEKNDSSKFYFSIAIMCGTVITVLTHL